MDREIVSDAQLVELINASLAATEAASHCTYDDVFALQEPDEDGCNWSPGYFSPGGDSPEVCVPVAARVVREMQAKYNLEELSGLSFR